MATKKVGDLIKEARTNAGLTQAGLAKLVDGVTASDISKAERGEKELSQAALKQIAKATGVTQASLLNAAKGSAGKSGKTASSGKTGSSAAGKTGGKKAGEYTLTAAEKKLVDLYRAADSDTKKAAVSLLKGEKADSGILSSLLNNSAISGAVGGVVDSLLGGKK